MGPRVVCSSQRVTAKGLVTFYLECSTCDLPDPWVKLIPDHLQMVSLVYFFSVDRDSVFSV